MLKDLPHAKWVAAGKQLILKGDFVDIESAILEVMAIAKQPPTIAWIDAATVRVPATADSKAAVAMTGVPNILHPGQFINDGLTDGGLRENSSNVSLIFGTGGAMWGSEKASQWYAIYALAANADTTFTIKAMPFMRFKSQASQIISLGNLTTPATGIGYGLTTNELVGGAIYVLSGASQGLVRAITANNNDNGTGGTITYSGTPLTMSQGDWFLVMPPSINFRWLGSVFNNSGSNIDKFSKQGNIVSWMRDLNTGYSCSFGLLGIWEDIGMACPLAILFSGFMTGGSGSLYYVGPPDATTGLGGIKLNVTANEYLRFAILNCKMFSYSDGQISYIPYAYEYPAGCGY
jgi:hypothetical protein